jgi:putative aldouronate transport system substrate-binding protein
MVKSKKLMLVMLSIVLTLSIFVAGCTGTVPGNETETQAPTTATSTTEQAKEDTLVHKTITLALEDDGSVDWTDHELFTMKLLAEAGNMTIDVLPIPQSDRDSKLQTLIASKNLPDLTYNEDENWYWEYAPRIAASLDEHWDKLPIFTEYIKKHPDYYTNFKCYDDKIYGIPQVMDSLGYYSYMWQIRADILEENGMKLDDVRTLDDFYNALKLLKDVKGMAPWIARTGGKQSVFVGRTASAFGSGDKVYWNADSDEYRVGPFDANYKLMIETLAKFYSEGLVHPEIFSMQDQVWEQMKMNEEGFFFIDNWKVRHSPSDVDWDFSIMLPPEVNGTRYYGAEDRPHASPDVKYWVISKDTKALDNILAALNWAFS